MPASQDNAIDVRVRNGYARSVLPDRAGQWFDGVTSVREVRGFHPLGVIPHPFSTSNNAVATSLTVGLSGTVALPISGKPYGVTGTAIQLFCSSSNTAPVFVTATDSEGQQFLEDLQNPVGLRFGIGTVLTFTFNESSAPTFKVVAD